MRSGRGILSVIIPRRRRPVKPRRPYARRFPLFPKRIIASSDAFRAASGNCHAVLLARLFPDKMYPVDKKTMILYSESCKFQTFT